MKTARSRRQSERGAVLVYVAISMVAMLGVAALAVDVGYLYVIRNELQNSADAGALAGARVLYSDDGQSIRAALVNTDARLYAGETSEAPNGYNQSEKHAVTVEQVEIGHWSFSTRSFTPVSGAPQVVQLWGQSTAALDANPSFINAVRVRTARSHLENTFFATLFGGPGMVRASAVAYIGFAGTLQPHEVDFPIAICRQALGMGEEYSCNVGRMINSSGPVGQQQGNDSENTGGWTNFTQPCVTANPPTVSPYVCPADPTGNPNPISLGEQIGSTGGADQSIFKCMMDRWIAKADTNADGKADVPVSMTLPVINCDSNNVSPCSDVVGAVEVTVMWMNENTDPQYNKAPTVMAAAPGDENQTPFACSVAPTSQENRMQCWNEFTGRFQLKDVYGNAAPYESKALYFLPSCVRHPPAGKSGGENFGILAKIPVLVQ